MSSPRARIFLLALAGIVLGIALSRLSGGLLAAIVAGLLCFLLWRMRRGR